MKVRFLLFSLAMLLTFGAAAFADGTRNYVLVAPSGNTSMDYTQGAYNEIGNLIISVDGEGTFSADTVVKVKVSYDAEFTNGTDKIAYKIVYDDNRTDVAQGGVISVDVSLTIYASVKIGAVITGDFSNISDGDYGSDISFIGLPVVGQKNYEFGTYENSTLKWRVLSVDEGNNRALLVTEQVVKKMKFLQICCIRA